jgi:mono/diheme cytochrome c family protein
MQATIRRLLSACGGLARRGFFVAAAVSLFLPMGCGRSKSAATNQSASAKSPAAEQARSPRTEKQGPPIKTAALLSGRELYLQHCTACHGDEGNGQGLAARFLFPKPRDFGRGQFRLVSTKNYVPSREDIRAVLVRGMPGSSMPPWAHLRPEEIDRLADEVLRLYQAGTRAKIVAELKEADEEIVEAEVAGQVRELTSPGELADVPQIAADDPAAVARGGDIYIKQSCHACHGKEGRGDGQQVMVDNDGLPTRPRDLTRGIFKGQHDAASIYRRIVLGMPGTPMPSSSNLTPEQMVDLAQFIRSLSDESTRQAALIKRERIVAKRASALPDSPASAAWNDISPTALRTMPLWWRDDFAPTMNVQAVHDGRNLAFRLSWNDATKNDSAVRTEEFEDLAAVQLSGGGAEPFLGMGAVAGAIELWQWRGGIEASGADDQIMDDYPFESAVYQHVAGGKPLPDYITARSLGNPLATRQHAGHSIAAMGPGTITIRPQASQHVAVAALWQEGRWSVVLQRPLEVPSDDGLRLSAGNDYSTAFAVWDGAMRDRAAQKLVTIWQDLHLE